MSSDRVSLAFKSGAEAFRSATLAFLLTSDGGWKAL
jgi:hypothetical protein